MKSISFKNLSPTEFEEFCFDLIQKLGFFNVDWRKGTGLKTSPADRGRDIVFQREYPDVDGTKYFETWFAECKQYTKGLPPTELQNLLSWANAERPEGIIFIVSNFLSNSAKDYLENYQKNNKPAYKIKYWERPVLEKLVKNKISLLRKYDLIKGPIRNVENILAAEEELTDKIWYDRNQLLINSGHLKDKPQYIIKGAVSAMKTAEKKYGKKNLGPYNDIDWGMINGKLSALRWVLGEDWDILDT